MSEPRGHYCVDCAHELEHRLSEMCPSCGRCVDHCKADGHDHMSKKESE